MENQPTESELTTDELLAMLTAVAHPLRLRIVAELAGGRVHVSELARRLGMSRPLLYMHLDRLEKAGMVTGHLELSEDGKAMKYFQLAPFELRVTAETILAALQADGTDGTDGTGGVSGSTEKGEFDMRDNDR
jgi:DNA-binding transcriptional ArsR family regulator